MLSAEVPPRMALTVPFCRSKAAVEERTPVEPAIVPLVRLMVPTVSEKVAILSVPPLTVTGPVDRALAMPYVSVPPEMVVRPV